MVIGGRWPVIGAALLIACAMIASGSAQQSNQPSQPQSPARDTSARPATTTTATPTGRMSGRVVAADSGRPIKRARVFITAAELPGRGVLTDDNGAFLLTDLPAGRYTINASKSGYIQLSYGQRRPLQAGTPLQLLDGQQFKGVDFALPRGGVISGRVSDESGDVMPGVAVQVMRYQYAQGDRRLAPAGQGQTDDRGVYRVWGLNPGEYYVSATARNEGLGRGIPQQAVQVIQDLVAGRGGAGGRGGGRGGGQGIAALAGLLPTDDQDQLMYAPTYYPGVGRSSRSQSGHRRRQPGSRGHRLRAAARAHGARQRPRRKSGRIVDGAGQRQPDAARRNARGRARQQLRRTRRLGRPVQHRQRPARPLHAPRAQQRPRRAALDRAAALGSAATSRTSSSSCRSAARCRGRSCFYPARPVRPPT